MNTCISPNGLNRYQGEEAPNRLFVGTVNGIAVLEREGQGGSWRVARRVLEGQHISSILLEPTRGGMFAGVHGGGLHFSADGGATWQPRMRGITVEHVFSLSCTHNNGQVTLFAGTEPAHLFRSTDYGQSWEEISSAIDVPDTEKWTFPAPPHSGHFKTMAFDPRNVETFYAGVEQGALLKTSDGGKTWRELAGFSRPDDAVYKDVHQLNLRPGNPDEIFMTGGCGLYHSPDGGETWEHLTDRTFRIGYPDQLQFSPVDDRVIFMSGSSTNPGTWRESHQAEATIVRSRDGGRTWEAAGAGLPEHMRANIEAMALASWPGGFELFAANTDGEVYGSVDGAEHWTIVAAGLEPISKGGHYRPLQAAAA